MLAWLLIWILTVPAALVRIVSYRSISTLVSLPLYSGVPLWQCVSSKKRYDSTPHLISNHTRSLSTSKLPAQYSVLHEFAVGACLRDDASVAKFHGRISVRHVRRGIRCCHCPPWCPCRLRCYLQCLSKGHERVARNGGPCVHAEIAVCQCVATVDPHQFILGNRPLLYFWLSAKLTG